MGSTQLIRLAEHLAALPPIRWIGRLTSEPPPDYCFEISERSLAVTSRNLTNDISVELLPEAGLIACLGRPNLLKPNLYREILIPLAGSAKPHRTRTALVIPDHAVRIAILDFDEFPEGDVDRWALIRFRLRKTLPFHIDEAGVSFFVQSKGPGHVEVLIAVIAGPILKEYESLFTDAGFRVGLVLPSSLAALPHWKKAARGLTAVARMSGTMMSLFLLEPDRLRLVRSIDLSDGEGAELGTAREAILGAFGQTLAYAEDQIGSSACKVLLSGFGPETESLRNDVRDQFGMPCAALAEELDESAELSPGLAGLLQETTLSAPPPINLASRPFGRERSRNAAQLAACIALSCSLLVLLVLILLDRSQAADMRKALESRTLILNRLQLEQTRYLQVLSQPKNADVFAWSFLLNQLIAHRGLSWARIFDDLSTVLPADMRLVGMRVPQVGADDTHGVNRVQLDMVVATEKPDTLLAFLNALQASDLFGSATVMSQTSPTQDDPTCKFRVLVAYAQKI